MRKFNDYDTVFPEILIDLGFEDNSWRNEAAGRATLTRPDGAIVVVWCAEPNPEDREFPENERFIVALQHCEECYGCQFSSVDVGFCEEEKDIPDLVAKAMVTPRPWCDTPEKGARVVFVRMVDRYPHASVKIGETGTITTSEHGLIGVKLDREESGLAEWNNEIRWEGWERGQNSVYDFHMEVARLGG